MHGWLFCHWWCLGLQGYFIFSQPWLGDEKVACHVCVSFVRGEYMLGIRLSHGRWVSLLHNDLLLCFVYLWNSNLNVVIMLSLKYLLSDCVLCFFSCKIEVSLRVWMWLAIRLHYSKLHQTWQMLRRTLHTT